MNGRAPGQTGAASAHRVAGLPQRALHLGDPQGAEVEDRGGEYGVRAGVDRRGEVLDRTGAAARDHRDRDRRADEADQLEVEALGGAVRVHRVEEDLAGTEGGGPDGPLDRVDAGRGAPTVGGHLEAG